MIGNQPICIGAIGGSGTRVVAHILNRSGIYMGADLNHALDNLWFTLFFKRLDICDLTDDEFEQRSDHFKAIMTGCKGFQFNAELLQKLSRKTMSPHDSSWLEARVQSYQEELLNADLKSSWGWKEPNTHICIDRLKLHTPKLRYIHVYRNGLDMAFSENYNQLNMWGKKFLRRDVAPIPKDALAYWVAAHDSLEQRLKGFRDDEVLKIKFEDLCYQPKGEIGKILKFCGLPINDNVIHDLSQSIKPPRSIGRYKAEDLTQFAFSDVKALEAYGYDPFRV